MLCCIRFTKAGQCGYFSYLAQIISLGFESATAKINNTLTISQQGYKKIAKLK